MSAVQNIAVPPHNIEAEKSVLGAVLLDERHLHSLLIEEHLRPEHFYREQHGAVFAAMLELYEGDRKIDHLTVAETLRQYGAARTWAARRRSTSSQAGYGIEISRIALQSKVRPVLESPAHRDFYDLSCRVLTVRIRLDKAKVAGSSPASS